ncbi:hypothetical protein [Nostoc sp.]
MSQKYQIFADPPTHHASRSTWGNPRRSLQDQRRTRTRWRSLW